jgi:hypothetical protein
MAKWLVDDAKAREAAGKRGVAGEPHWKIELEVRHRSALPKAGRTTVLPGAVEKKIMVTVATAAMQRTPHM